MNGRVFAWNSNQASNKGRWYQTQRAPMLAAA